MSIVHTVAGAVGHSSERIRLSGHSLANYHVIKVTGYQEWSCKPSIENACSKMRAKFIVTFWCRSQNPRLKHQVSAHSQPSHQALRLLARKLHQRLHKHWVRMMELKTKYRERMLQNTCQVHSYCLVQVAEPSVEAPSVPTEPNHRVLRSETTAAAVSDSQGQGGSGTVSSDSLSKKSSEVCRVCYVELCYVEKC